MSTYRGIAFPFRKSETSFPEEATDGDLIQDSLAQIVLTARGERVMRDDFGSQVHAFVFENNNEVLEQALKAEISNVINRFEPRVVVRNVGVEREDTNIIVTVEYVNRLTGQTDQLSVVLPTSSEG